MPFAAKPSANPRPPAPQGGSYWHKTPKQAMDEGTLHNIYLNQSPRSKISVRVLGSGSKYQDCLESWSWEMLRWQNSFWVTKRVIDDDPGSEGFLDNKRMASWKITTVFYTCNQTRVPPSKPCRIISLIILWAGQI